VGVVELFSKRQKRARGEMPDVYVYDTLPQSLRVQIIYIIRDAFGVDKDRYRSNHAVQAYKSVHQILCREYGVFTLIKSPKSDQDAIFNFFPD